jgi:hypothetical protein
LRRKEEVDDTSNDGLRGGGVGARVVGGGCATRGGGALRGGGHYEDEVVGVTNLLQDPHSHADTGLATSFTLL